MYVSLSVSMWRAYGNPNPSMDLDKNLYTHRYLSKYGFGAVLTLAHSPLGRGGGIFENCLQNKIC